MDWTDLIGPIVAVLTFVIGGWIAVKNANNARFSRIESEQAAMHATLDTMANDTRVTRELSEQLARLSQQLADLAEDVRKHNTVIERTYIVERDMKTMWARHDELKERVHELEQYHKKGA